MHTTDGDDDDTVNTTNCFVSPVAYTVTAQQRSERDQRHSPLPTLHYVTVPALTLWSILSGHTFNHIVSTSLNMVNRTSYVCQCQVYIDSHCSCRVRHFKSFLSSSDHISLQIIVSCQVRKLAFQGPAGVRLSRWLSSCLIASHCDHLISEISTGIA